MVEQIVLMGVMVLAAVFGSIGQILLKLASQQWSFRGLLVNGFAWGFVLCYAVAVVINIWVYRVGGRVAVTYPVIALSYLFTAVLAWWWLKETLNWWMIAGIIIIIGGVSLVGYGASL